jgi:hypothetical protein
MQKGSIEMIEKHLVKEIFDPYTGLHWCYGLQVNGLILKVNLAELKEIHKEIGNILEIIQKKKNAGPYWGGGPPTE